MVSALLRPRCRPIASHIIALANSAASAPICVAISCFFGELVALCAVCLARISRSRPLAAQDILPTSDGFKVVWVNAGSVATKVIDLEPIWDGPNTEFIGQSMGKHCLSVQLEASVAQCPKGCPFPAVAEGNLRPESRDGFGIMQLHRNQPFGVTLPDVYPSRELSLIVPNEGAA
ncbi:hypothetical protein LCGC14_1393080 [marine sediment metagenome]|uniref:Uncharacterized protein n=1 Tax=marine sediment metagenome TaxID=412755 RepID=A0A0F9JZC0_9ZZZZ